MLHATSGTSPYNMRFAQPLRTSRNQLTMLFTIILIIIVINIIINISLSLYIYI